MDGIRDGINAIAKMLVGFPVWRISKSLSPSYKAMSEGMDQFGAFAKSKIDEAKKRIQEKTTQKENIDEISVLEKLILKHGPESNLPFVTAFDMVAGGIDTTGASS